MLSILLGTPAVQSKLGRIATDYLNEEFHTHIKVSKVDLSFLGSVELKEVEILDHYLDSMIYVKNLTTSIYSYRNIIKNKIELGEVSLTGVRFIMRTHAGEREDAFVQFVKNFENKNSSNDPLDFLLSAEVVNLEGAHFVILDENKENSSPLTFYEIEGSVRNFNIQGPNISGEVRGISFVESHDIEVENLTSDFSYTREEMKLLNTRLETKSSKVDADIVFYRDGSLADFKNKVKFDGDIKDANLSLRDLNKLYGEFGKLDVLHFKTKLSGTLNDMRAKDFRLRSDLKTIVDGDFHLVNSFNTEKGFSVEAQLSNLVSDYDNLKILIPNILSKSLPSSLKKLGRFNMIGHSFISNEIIDAQIELNTDIGSTIADLRLTNIRSIDKATYRGHIKIIDFDLGKMVNDSLVGRISAEADIDGEGFTLEELNTTVDGEVSSYEYKGYVYGHININGRFQNKKFEGEMIINDANIKLKFNGLADLSKEIYKFDFKTVVAHANFNELNLFTRDSIAILKGDIDIDFEGTTIENLVGAISFERTSYTNEKESFYFEDFDISSTFNDTIRTITINSPDIINGEIVGDFQFLEIPKLAQNALGSIYSNYLPDEVDDDQFLDFKFNIYNKIIDVFFPYVKLASNSYISGFVNSDEKNFNLKVRSPRVEIYDNVIDSIRLDINNKNPLFNTQLSIQRIKGTTYDISKLDLINVTLNDTLFFRTEFVGGVKKTDIYNLGFYHTIDNENQSVIGIEKSNIKFKDTDWVLNPKKNKQNKVVFDSKFEHFDIRDFDIVSGDQKIEFFGSTFGPIQKDLNLKMENVALEAISPNIKKWDLTGVINGTLQYDQTDESVLPVANFDINNFSVNGSHQGDLKVGMIGRNSYKTYNINMALEKDGYDALFANGVLDFAADESTVDVGFEFERFKLDILGPIGDEDFTNIRGEIYGSARLSGLLNNPDMSGEFYLFDAGMAMPYLNVDYDFEGTTVINLDGQTIEIIDLTLKDLIEDTSGKLTGTISHNYFTDWKLDLNLTTKNLLILNTEQEEQSLYYGQGFIEGQANIYGYTDNLTIDVNAKTNKGTRFVIPMSDTKIVGDSRVVNFRSPKEIEEPSKLIAKDLLERYKGLSLNFNLEITKDTEIEMVLDEVSGSKLKGSGTGDLKIEIDTNGKFNIFGDFIIDNGIYNFNFKDVINKEFLVTQGGLISWGGDPYEADIDIETKVRVYANPKYLLENVYTSRDIAVDLVARFTGDLFDSKQDYDILLPDADSELKAELDFKLNGTNDLNTKMNNFGSLLFAGTFTSTDTSMGTNGVMMITGLSEELLSNALTNILNSGDSKLKVGVTYDIGDSRSDIENLQTQDQLGITVVTQINDKILIDGKLGVTGGANSSLANQSGLVGEVEIEFLLNDEGSLRSNVFNRQNEIQYSEEEEGYTQGVGISYQFDFDIFSEFLKRIGLKKKRVENDSIQIHQDAIPVKQPIISFKKSNIE